MFTPDQYSLLDFGQGRRLERFGPLVLDRPCPAVEGVPCGDGGRWLEAVARFAGRGTAGAADLMQVDVGQALRMITATSERENEITRLNQALLARSQELRQEAEDRQRLERELAELRAQRAQG